MPRINDGPVSSDFHVVAFQGGVDLPEIPEELFSPEMMEAREHAPSGDCGCWGIPFRVGRPVAVIV